MFADEQNWIPALHTFLSLLKNIDYTHGDASAVITKQSQMQGFTGKGKSGL